MQVLGKRQGSVSAVQDLGGRSHLTRMPVPEGERIAALETALKGVRGGVRAGHIDNKTYRRHG